MLKYKVYTQQLQTEIHELQEALDPPLGREYIVYNLPKNFPHLEVTVQKLGMRTVYTPQIVLYFYIFLTIAHQSFHAQLNICFAIEGVLYNLICLYLCLSCSI